MYRYKLVRFSILFIFHMLLLLLLVYLIRNHSEDLYR